MTVQPTREQLRALADKATPGPWSYADYGDPSPEHWPVGLIETDGGEEAWACDTALAMSEPDAAFIAAARTAVPQLLDQLDRAEHRIARLEAQTSIRGRAVVIYRDRARKAEAERDWNIRSSRLAKEERIKANARAESAEARIRAVQDVLDQSRDDITMHTYPEQLNADIRRALDGDA